MAQCQLKNESREDEAMKVLLKCIHWISSENLPLSKFKSLINLLHDLEVPDISILKQNSMNCDSKFTASEMLDSLAQVAEDDLKDTLMK
ncbi:hypothetical protein DPMN_076643 [Dreissena polymorpha]|uniref:Uncharacterized protein n=1 Tax=Dreissena polymorpha TaxID=45954 RepID=A0A9D3YP15_DREPO|nr:hypothetical protein DPMN_076643 [Dreissena polymorpha]